MSVFGLREDWRRVLDALEDLVGVYGRVNRWISLGMDVKLRRDAVAGALHGSKTVLDAGCGDGIFTEIALEENNELDVVMLDVLQAMLVRAKQVRPAQTHPVQGVFEHLPLRMDAIDTIIAAFAVRDSVDGETAMRELTRALKRDGRLIVCDIAKPDNRLYAALIGFYWRFIAPILGLIAASRKGIRVAAIILTYRRWPRRARLVAELRRWFEDVSVKDKLLGGAIIVRAGRKKTA
ncbi:MAG: class I SAM-dependent methyltransferase [Aigarchaeota archaeon]|nr:class I SAM-dependent methyltransferase [Candidatus Pelearchaeum maunauluense]